MASPPRGTTGAPEPASESAPQAPLEAVPDPVRVGRALARLSRVLDHASSTAGLSVAQYRVLVFVAEQPQRASALATKVDVQRATLSAIVGGLERSGFLQRTAVESDGRGVQLELTPAGAEALVRAERSLAGQLGEIMTAGGVDPSGLAALLEAMLGGFESMCAVADGPQDQTPPCDKGAKGKGGGR